MSIGVLAHLCHKGTVQDVAQKVGSYQFQHVQLALWKAFNEYDFMKPGRLSPGMAKYIKKEFERHGSSISVLGCYLHLFERDEKKHQVNKERYKEMIRYARIFGTSIVATETGKIDSGHFTKGDWEKLKETLQELLEEAEKWGVFIGIEPAQYHLIDNAKKLRKLIDEVPSSHLGVVLDPGNLITEKNYKEQDAVIEEMFQLLGDRIVAFQAKDCFFGENDELSWVPVGQGHLNYELIFARLFQYKPHIEIILDSINSENILEAQRFIKNSLQK
ncbi:sugar phosphate isomerase/epimerase family protein [Alkalihalobacillus sp. 1P02AB]|uniref:sugar phosphate isomerase/epimerase family protein n=1 Tax=Alkalihalobacillus sp. 1P02AB TaxID=3132260 RepID=UPI0039A68B69